MKLIFVGDVDLSTPHNISPSVKKFLAEGDMVLGTLNSPVEYKHLDLLKDSNLKHLNLANSKLISHGSNRLHSIKVHLDWAKILYTGAGADKNSAAGMFIRNFEVDFPRDTLFLGFPNLVVENKKFFRVGFLGVSLVGKEYEALPEKPGIFYINIDHTASLIKKVKVAASKVDMLIVNIEWDLKGISDYKIPIKIRRLSRALVNAGAKIIHGNYKNKYPIEIYKNSLIIWSCGQFMEDPQTSGMAVLASIELEQIPYERNKYSDYLWYFTGYKNIKTNITYTLKRIINQNGNIVFE